MVTIQTQITVNTESKNRQPSDGDGGLNLLPSHSRIIFQKAQNYIDPGTSLEELLLEGKKEALKSFSDFIPDRGISFDVYFVWRLKSRFYQINRTNSAKFR